jgi:tetratricopeptide (TPR) repeat protein
MSDEKVSFAPFGANTGAQAQPTQARAPQAGAGNISRGFGMGGTSTARPQQAKSEKAFNPSSIFDLVISVSFMAIFFGVPIFFTGLTFQGIAFEKQLYFYFWLLLGVIAWVSKGVLSGEMKIRRTPLDIPIALFLIFNIVSAVFSVDRWHSFWGFFGDPSRGVVSLTALILAYYLILSHFNMKRFQQMFHAFIASGFIVVFWSFLVILKIRFLPDALERMAPLSLIGTVSTLTTFLSILLPLFMTALFMLWREDLEIKKSRRTIITVIYGLGIFMTLFLLLALYSYVSWPVVLIGLSFFMVYILAQIVRPNERLTWMPMVTFVVMLAFLMIGSNKLSRAVLPVEVAPNSNLSMQIAKESLKENFLLGVGPANYGYAFSMYRPAEYNQNELYTLRFYQGNGMFFESLVTLGALGTVLLAVLWLSFMSLGIYLLSMEKSKNKIYSLGLWTTAIMFLIAGGVASLNGALVLIATLLGILSLGILFMESGSEEKYLHLSLKAAPKYALALAFIFMVVSAGVAFLFVFMGKVLVADLKAGQAIRMAAVTPSTDVINLLAQASQTYPQEGRYPTRLGQEFMALANLEAGKDQSERNTDAIANYVRSAVAAAERGRQLMPNDVLASESMGLIYENAALYASDAMPKAEELYKRSQELEPENPLYDIKIGQVKRAMADTKEEGAERTALYQEAKTAFEASIAKKSNLAVAHYQLALVESRLKMYDEALKSTENAMRLDKQNVNYRYNLGVLYQIRDGEGDLDKAEKAFKDILTDNDKLVDVRLSLGLLYEKKGQRDQALEAYRKLLEVLPSEGEGNVKQTREQIQKLINNVQSGAGNINQPAPAAPEPEPVIAPQPVAPDTQAAPVTPPATTPAQ